MTRVRFALCVAALLTTAGSLPGTAAGRFDQKLSKDKQVVHALNRLTFGPRPGDVDRVRRLGVDKWIQQQLQPQLIPENPTVVDRLQSLDTLRLATWQIFEKYQQSPLGVGVNGRAVVVNAPAFGRPSAQVVRGFSLNELLTPEQRRVAQTGSVEERRALLMSFDHDKRKQILRILSPTAVAGIPELRRESLAAREPARFVNQELIESRMYRALYSHRQLEEVLVDFWLNHFNVFNAKGATAVLLTSYERDAIRPHVLGRFRDLLLATARHPAMLLYLDNWQSEAPRDDGSMRPANGRRAGLNENYGRELMELHTLGVDGGYSQADVIAVARAFTGWTIYEVNTVAEFQFNPATHDRKEKIVLGHTIAAGGGEQDGLQVIDILVRHPSTAKFISRKLAQRFVADSPPESLVERMAATFATSDGDLRAVLHSMFMSREFLSEGAWQAKLKSPLEFVLSGVRALDGEVTDSMPLAQRIADLGQPLYGKPEPTGYATTSDAWANSAGFLGRMNFASALTAGKVEGVRIDAARLPRRTDTAAKQLLGPMVSASTMRRLQQEANGELSPTSIAAVLIGAPDFQRR